MCKHTYIRVESQGDGQGGFKALMLMCSQCLEYLSYKEIKQWSKAKVVEEKGSQHSTVTVEVTANSP